MARALELAAKGIGTTSPNPRVGAVIVKDGKIIAEGWHKKAGGDHAEVAVLKKVGYNAVGATLYINFEPCCTYGRTPPCTKAIIDSGIKRVVTAMTDPNWKHRGKGLRILRGSGIETSTGILRNEARKVNAGFVKLHTRELPYVIAKAAVSLDGKIASATGDSRWITNEKARKYAHQLRRESDAVLVGVNTIIKDNPMLTVRHVAGRKKQPRRIVTDSVARIKLSAKILQPRFAADTIVAVTSNAPKDKIKEIRLRGAKVILCRTKGSYVNLHDLFRQLAKQHGILYVLVEGGSRILTSVFEEGIADEITFFYAPIIIGGEKAPTPVGGKGTGKIADALRIKEVDIECFGDNILVRGCVQRVEEE